MARRSKKQRSNEQRERHSRQTGRPAEREPGGARSDAAAVDGDWVERQPAWLRSLLIRIDRVMCAAATVLEDLHRNLTVFSGSAEHRQEGDARPAVQPPTPRPPTPRHRPYRVRRKIPKPEPR